MGIFLVVCDATVAVNDVNLVIEAEDEEEAIEIAKKRLPKEFVNKYKVTDLIKNPDYKFGILLEYYPPWR